MFSHLRLLRNILRRGRPSSRALSNISSVQLPPETPIEEETFPHYEAEHYYPVHIGDTFNARYRVAGKLGYGAYSTTWLCHDIRAENYVAAKVSTSPRKFPSTTLRELKIYEHLANVESAHRGQSLIRELYDEFELDGPAGNHLCLVQQPMHMTLLEMLKLNPKPFNLALLKLTLRRILHALDFLHSEANVIHTDLKTDNIMLSIHDCTMLADFAKAEEKESSPCKKIDDLRTVYQSRRFRRPVGGNVYGLPILCDLGEARIGMRQETGPFVQPHIYRAPEVIFEMPWGGAVDIWNLAGLIWDLFEGEHLFGDIFDSKGGHDPFKHLALMVAVAGPPPSEFVKRRETTAQWFDPDGSWTANDEAAVPSASLETLERRLVGREKELFIRFMRFMLKWLPEERKTAEQLLQDPWLQQPLVTSS